MDSIELAFAGIARQADLVRAREVSPRDEERDPPVGR